MTPQNFVIWFRGFSEACHHLNPTPKQWEHILETLKEVNDTQECQCGKKTYTYPYQGYTGENAILNHAKNQLND